ARATVSLLVRKTCREWTCSNARHDRAAERPEHVVDPRHAEHVGLEPEREDRDESGAEPRGARQDDPEQRDRPRDEEERAEQAGVDTELGVRRLARLDLRAGA